MYCHTTCISGPPESGPPGMSIATMHSPPAIYERVRGWVSGING